MSYQKFNSQFKPKTRNAVLHKPLSKVSYEYNDYDDMNSFMIGAMQLSGENRYLLIDYIAFERKNDKNE